MRSNLTVFEDHAVGITAQNVYRGQSGFYIVEEPDVEARLGLPQGDFDITLGLTCKQYDNNGQLTSIADEKDDVFGDVVEVNGQPWPFLNVEPRKYRFRLLDMAVSRSFQLSILDSNSKPINFQIVASDAGFTSAPVTLNSLIISMAERYEIVVDFAVYAGQTLTMTNTRGVFVADDFPGTDRIMQFRVGQTVSSQENNGQVAASLVPLPSTGSKTSVDRTFKFDKE
jgi:bilirubin oxidase